MNNSQVFISYLPDFVKKWPKTYEIFTVSIRGDFFPVKEIDERHLQKGTFISLDKVVFFQDKRHPDHIEI